MCIYTHAHTDVCVCIHSLIHLHCMYNTSAVDVCVCIHTLDVCVCIHTLDVCVCIHTLDVCVCIHTHIHLHHRHLCVITCIITVCVCVCVCVFTVSNKTCQLHQRVCIRTRTHTHIRTRTQTEHLVSKQVCTDINALAQVMSEAISGEFGGISGEFGKSMRQPGLGRTSSVSGSEFLEILDIALTTTSSNGYTTVEKVLPYFTRALSNCPQTNDANPHTTLD